MRYFLSCIFIFWASTGFGQDRAETLADIRAELTALNAEILGLRNELTTTGAGSAALTGDLLQRVDAIEAEMSRLTASTEALQNRIDRVVADGTNRIGDLEFRLVELEGGDLSTLGATSTLGGDDSQPTATTDTNPEEQGVELAVAEKADFERAETALAEEEFELAAERFSQFLQSYPGSPLTADARFFRGQALEKQGDWNSAARAYLDSYSGDPNSSRAPTSLFRLGVALNALGQSSEACLMLAEVGKRFPTAPEVATANETRQTIGCS